MAAPVAPVSTSPRTAGAGAPVRVELPEDGSGPALAACVRSIRVALARGGVVVDPRPAQAWSPGPRLVLEHLRATAERRGRCWEESPRG